MFSWNFAIYFGVYGHLEVINEITFLLYFVSFVLFWNLIWLNYEIVEGDLIGDSLGVCDAESIIDS